MSLCLTIEYTMVEYNGAPARSGDGLLGRAYIWIHRMRDLVLIGCDNQESWTSIDGME